MVSNGILNTGILAEISRDRLIASVRVLFLRFLRVFTLAVPTGSTPSVTGQAALPDLILMKVNPVRTLLEEPTSREC